MSTTLLRFFPLLLATLLSGCGALWNNPYPSAKQSEVVLYRAFTDRPKHLDPARSYSEDEAIFLAQIYEPPLQYHYLKRPYTLVPMTVASMPVPRDIDAEGKEAASDSPDAMSVYDITIKPGILYQPHPAFARDASGNPVYGHLTGDALRNIFTLSDFKATGMRELIAEDYVYQIKRLAHPRLFSPIFSVIAEHLVGLQKLQPVLRAADKELVQRAGQDAWLDLTKYPLEGVEVVDRYTFRITLKDRYPQFTYWLAMSFFAPVPVEVDQFYSQPGMAERNITLDWYPVGTGPYMLTENNPNARMVLERNPNYRGERYPDAGESSDAAAGLLTDAGKPIPFIDKVVFSRERESVPYWNKFLEGYYDFSSISSDNFDQAVRISIEGDATVSPEMAAKSIRLESSVATSIRYMAFNWLNPIVGGPSERARKLRQAISIAVDEEEYISIFANGRGVSAQSPIPPGIFGYREGVAGINPVVYDFVDEAPKRKPIEKAKRLLAEAGYPGGRDATGKPLVLYLDATESGPDDKARMDWYHKQFAKLDVELEIRGTDYNRFQEKVRTGAAQIFIWGWNADYPDPENFLFLFATNQGKVKFQGENAANYSNPQFDALFDKMQTMENSPERAATIYRMLAILQQDAPWSFGYHPKDYSLNHGWLSNLKPNQMARNNVKYMKIDVAKRDELRREWNQPVLWPIGAGALALALVLAPAVVSYRRRERVTARSA
jgi:oligopeptide transport system substrate-binding protein